MNKTIKQRVGCSDIDIRNDDIMNIFNLLENRYNKNKNEIIDDKFKNEIDEMFSDLKKEKLPKEVIMILDSPIVKKIVTILLYDNEKYGGSPDDNDIIPYTNSPKNVKKTFYMNLTEKMMFVKTIVMFLVSIIVIMLGIQMIYDFKHYITIELKLSNFNWSDILKTKSQATYLEFIIVNFINMGSRISSNIYKENEAEITLMLQQVMSELKKKCFTNVSGITGENTYITSTFNAIETMFNPNVSSCGLRTLKLHQDEVIFNMGQKCSNLYTGFLFLGFGTSIAVSCVKSIIYQINDNKRISNTTRKNYKTIKNGGSKNKKKY